MRRQPVVLALACALAAMTASGAHAQSRASLSDRVAALEARDQAQGQQGIDLLNRIAQLEADVKDLRSQVEQMRNDNQQAADRAKAQYIDLDSRLARLEGHAPTSPPAATATPPATRNPAPATAPSAAGRAAAPATSPSAPAAGNGGDEAAYKAAFDAMRAEHYADSASQFNAFVQQYPNSTLVPNAYYWMGESFYVTQNYQYALDAFRKVVDRFPDSPKAAGALLKVGYCQDGLKQRDAAKATLRQVISQYPTSEEASQAQRRLNAMVLESGG